MCRLLWVFFMRVLLNSLEIAPSCRSSASRTSWCQCREAERAEPQGWGLCAAVLSQFAVRISRENPSSCSQAPVLSWSSTHGTLGALPLARARPGLPMETAGWDPCWSRGGFPAWSPLLEEKAALLSGERERERGGMGTSPRTRDLGFGAPWPGCDGEGRGALPEPLDNCQGC